MSLYTSQMQKSAPELKSAYQVTWASLVKIHLPMQETQV